MSGPAWVPTTEEVAERLGAGPARRLHGLLDAPGPPPGPGGALPPLWHWLHHLPDAAQADLGSDGHPRTGRLLPPAPHPRRMFAGGTVTLSGPLHLEEVVRRRSTATAPVAKEGRSGPLAFVTLRHVLLGADGATRVEEEQQLVYRPPPTGPAPRTPGRVPHGWPWHLALTVDEALLFRFSALTYNAHRIHYDRRYATTVEGHPGLVVHGPLVAVGLAEVVRRHLPARAIERFAFRAVQPATAPTTIVLVGRPAPDDDRTVELRALDDGDGATVMTAEAVLDAPATGT